MDMKAYPSLQIVEQGLEFMQRPLAEDESVVSKLGRSTLQACLRLLPPDDAQKILQLLPCHGLQVPERFAPEPFESSRLYK